MKQVTINLYSFNELNEVSQGRAISEHQSFLQDTPVECENEDGTTTMEYEDYTPNEVIDNILANDYIFFENGKLANCVTYVGGHPKKGKTEFTFYGRIYDITV